MHYHPILFIFFLACKNGFAQDIQGAGGLASLFVTIYQNDNQQGNQQSLPIGACQNIEASMNDQTTSVNTHGRCVYLCQDANCQGRCIKLQPNCGWPECCPNHANIGLPPCNFNDVASSVKGC